MTPVLAMRAGMGFAPRSPQVGPDRARFDGIFLCRTGFVILDHVLARQHANQAELLRVLDRPEIPLHTNDCEKYIHCYITRRKVSAGTRSNDGRDCRDAFLSLTKTYEKLGIPIRDFLRQSPKKKSCLRHRRTQWSGYS